MKIYHALWHKYKAEIAKEESEIQILLNNPVGVADHTCFVEELEKKIENLDKAKGLLQTLDGVFQNIPSPEDVMHHQILMQMQPEPQTNPGELKLVWDADKQEKMKKDTLKVVEEIKKGSSEENELFPETGEEDTLDLEEKEDEEMGDA